MNKRLLIIAGVLIVIAIGLFVASKYVFNKSNVTPAATQTTTPQPVANSTVTPVAFPLSDADVAALESQGSKEYDFAFSKAKEWRNDCAPVAVVIKYAGSIDINNGKSTYVFLSPSLPDYYFTLTLDQAKNAKGENNYERVLNFKADYFLPQNSVVLPLKYWAINYVDALKKADDSGGKNIRSANKNYDVNLVLSEQQGGLLLWDVEYLVNGNKLYSTTFDAYQGKVQ